jgi:hypothetical protein
MAGLVESSPVVYGNHLMWEFSIFTSSGEVAESATIFIDAYTGEYFLYTTL